MIILHARATNVLLCRSMKLSTSQSTQKRTAIVRLYCSRRAKLRPSFAAEASQSYEAALIRKQHLQQLRCVNGAPDAQLNMLLSLMCGLTAWGTPRRTLSLHV